MTARHQPTGDKNLSGKSTGRNLPLFAQPVNASKFPTPLTGKPGVGWSRPAVWSLAVITCGVLLALARPDNAQNVPASQTSGTRSGSTLRVQARTTPSAATPAVTPAGNMPEESRRSVDFYTQTVRGNLFNAPQPPALPPVKLPPPVVVVQPKPPVVPPVEINPFADWSYTGTMTSGDQVTALIENTKTKEGQFVKAGDSFMGSQVASITDQQIILQSGKTSRMLAKSDNWAVTPLDRSAIPSAGPQAAPQAAAPQAVQVQIDMSALQNLGNRGRGGRGGGQGFTLPNGRTFNPQQWQQRSQRMNQNFNQ